MHPDPVGESPAGATRARALAGCLLGTAVGDALGLPMEGIGRRRQLRLRPQLDRYRLLLGRGLTSDDTEHACMVAQSLIVSAGDPARFARSLAWRMRWWLLGMPAGIGMATLRGIVRLWLGFPDKSGVRSAGNGPAMRVAVIGVAYGAQSELARALVLASTRITHRDPRAEAGALAVALAAHLSASAKTAIAARAFQQCFRDFAAKEYAEFASLIDAACASVQAGESAAAFAARIGCAEGVTGFVNHTVPVAIHVWLAHQHDVRAGLEAVIRLGGDTDTTAAIVGALIGARVGVDGIPSQWIDSLAEWPRSVRWITRLAERLGQVRERGTPAPALAINPIALLLRNVLFLCVVLAHGLRRLLPPY